MFKAKLPRLDPPNSSFPFFELLSLPYISQDLELGEFTSSQFGCHGNFASTGVQEPVVANIVRRSLALDLLGGEEKALTFLNSDTWDIPGSLLSEKGPQLI